MKITSAKGDLTFIHLADDEGDVNIEVDDEVIGFFRVVDGKILLHLLRCHNLAPILALREDGYPRIEEL